MLRAARLTHGKPGATGHRFRTDREEHNKQKATAQKCQETAETGIHRWASEV